MKSVTFNFREVAIDGLPTESGEYAVVQSFLFHDQLNCLSFSEVHRLWNTYDQDSARRAYDVGSGFSGSGRQGEVIAWIPLNELDGKFSVSPYR